GLGVFPVSGPAGGPHAHGMLAKLPDAQPRRGQLIVEGRLDVPAEKMVAQAQPLSQVEDDLQVGPRLVHGRYDGGDGRTASVSQQLAAGRSRSAREALGLANRSACT